MLGYPKLPTLLVRLDDDEYACVETNDNDEYDKDEVHSRAYMLNDITPRGRVILATHKQLALFNHTDVTSSSSSK